LSVVVVVAGHGGEWMLWCVAVVDARSMREDEIWMLGDE